MKLMDNTSDGFKLITVTDSADVPEGRTFIDLSTVSETTYEYPVVDSEDRGFEIKNILKDGDSYYSYITADDGTVTKTELLIADDQLAAFEASLKSSNLLMTDDEAKNQALSEAIELAVSQNRTTVVIDGVDFLIQKK